MKIPVSFSKKEEELYSFVKSKRSPSVYIKDLIQADMDKSSNNNKKDIKENQSSSEDFYIFNDNDMED